jgi:hypothetical protein
VANCLVLTKVDADLAPSAEQSTAQGPSRVAHLHPSGVAEGHEPLTMDRRPSAVLSRVFAACKTPYVPRHVLSCRSVGGAVLVAERVVSPGAKMEIHPAALTFHLIDLALAVVLAASLERQ